LSRRVIENPGGIVGDLCFEQVEVEGEGSQYAVCEGGRWSLRSMLTVGNVNYAPIISPPWMPPGPPIEYGSEEELWRDVRSFVYEHIDFPFEELYDVYTAWVLATWRVEQWDAAAYLNFLGSPSSGKTRALDVLSLLCLRPIAVANISTAALFRVVEAWCPVLLIDEAQTLKQKDKSDIVAILNAGQRRGMKVVRIEKTVGEQMKLKAFDVFGFKALAGTESLTRTLTSRCIVFHMSKAVRPVRKFIDRGEALELRSKLLAYRFKHFRDKPPMENPIDIPDGRLVELYLPLIEVAPTPESRQAVERWARRSYLGMLKEEAAQPEAKVFEAIVELIPSYGMVIPVAAIAERLNEGLSGEDLWKPNVVSRIIGDKFGFERERVLRGGRKVTCVVIDEAVLDRLKRRYMPGDITSYGERNLADRASEWCRSRGEFTLEELAEAFNLSVGEAEKILTVLASGGEVEKAGDKYRVRVA
jgi:hypothetical protein